MFEPLAILMNNELGIAGITDLKILVNYLKESGLGNFEELIRFKELCKRRAELKKHLLIEKLNNRIPTVGLEDYGSSDLHSDLIEDAIEFCKKPIFIGYVRQYLYEDTRKLGDSPLSKELEMLLSYHEVDEFIKADIYQTVILESAFDELVCDIEKQLEKESNKNDFQLIEPHFFIESSSIKTIKNPHLFQRIEDEETLFRILDHIEGDCSKNLLSAIFFAFEDNKRFIKNARRPDFAELISGYGKFDFLDKVQGRNQIGYKTKLRATDLLKLSG